MSKQRDFIRNFMAVLDTTELSGVNALNEAVKICTKSKFTTIQALINQMVSDCRQTNDAEKFLQDYCGIDLSNEDTGAITGADAGGSIVKTAESVVPEVGSLQIYTKNSFKTRGGTFKLGQSYSSLTESEKFIWHALYTWWVPNALDLIEESYGSNYNLNDNVMTVYFKKFSDALASANHQTLNISTYFYGDIDTYDENGSANATYLDRVISHELTHSVMFKNSSWSFPQFIMEGMAELTHGIDDERKYSILNIAGNADSLKSALNVNDDSTGWTPAYAGGYMFLRYFAKQFSDLGLEFTSNNDFYANYDSKKTLNALGGNDNVNNFSSDKVKIYGADGNDKIYSSDSNGVTIDGGKGNDSIFSSKNKKSKIYGGAGKDTIENTGNYVTLSGGSGNDSISNEGNKVTITGGTGNDSIFSSGSKVTISGGAGNDSISNSGSNVTISGGTGNDSIYSGGAKNVKIYAGTGNDTIENYYGSKVTISGGAGNDSISNSGSEVTISGGTGNDSIFSSEAKYVTITGGAGKDYISLSSYGFGSEDIVIQYAEGDGNDTIYGFDFYDTFHITKGSYSAKADGNDVILTVGKSSVRFIGAIDTPIKVKTAKGKIETVTLDGDTDTQSGGGTDTQTGGGGGIDIHNYYNNTVVSGTNNNDTIYNGDLYYTSGNYMTIFGNGGNDYIQSTGSYVTISGDAGNDTIDNSRGRTVSILGGNGNDSISNISYNVTISGDNGNDFISNSGLEVMISGGNGNDAISNSGSEVTISGGAGDDAISIDNTYANTVLEYASGDGNDTIWGFNSDDTLNITSGTYTTQVIDYRVVVTVGEGKIILPNDGKQKINIVDSKGKLSELWVSEENNFISSDNLSSITENNLTPTSLEKIETNNFENLTRENNLITYSNK